MNKVSNKRISFCWTMLALVFSVAGLSAHAQNARAEAYWEMGSPVPGKRGTYGMAAVADWRVAPWVSVGGGFRLANIYPSGWGDLQLGATFFLQRNSERWTCGNWVDFSYYGPYPMNQLYYRLTFAWQSRHFRVELGNAFAFFLGSGVVKYHLFRPSFSIQGSLKEADAPWNLAFFIRNFNRFEAHGSRCVEWGARCSARVARRWCLFCEPYVVTVGNFNGTATFYHFNALLGGVFVW